MGRGWWFDERERDAVKGEPSSLVEGSCEQVELARGGRWLVSGGEMERDVVACCWLACRTRGWTLPLVAVAREEERGRARWWWKAAAVTRASGRRAIEEAAKMGKKT